MSGSGPWTSLGVQTYVWSRGALEPNTKYWYRARTCGTTQCSGPWSDGTTAATTFVAGRPNLWAEVEGGAVKLRWDRQHHAGTFEHYLIQKKVNGGAWEDYYTIYSADTLTHTHRAPRGSTYRYRIRMVTDEDYPATDPNASLNGQWGESEAITELRNDVPAAPAVTVRANGGSEIEVTWRKPARFTDDHANRLYELQVSELNPHTGPDAGVHWRKPTKRSKETDQYGPTRTSATYAGLAPRTTLYVRMRAKNDNGFGPWSGIRSATTQAGRASEPRNLRLQTDASGDEQLGETWATIAWDAPAEGDVTGYAVQRSVEDVAAGSWRNVGTTNAQTRTLRNSGLAPGTDYLYRVAARDRNGLGPWSAEFSVRTKAMPPEAPRLTVRPMKDVIASSVWLELKWNTPVDNGSPIIYYWIEWSPDGRNWPSAETPDVGGVEVYSPTDHGRTLSEHTYDIVGIEPGERRYFRMRAVSEAGLSETEGVKSAWSNVVNARASIIPPGKPLAIVEANGPSVDIWVDASTFDGGAPVTSHQIEAEYVPAGGTAETTRMITVNASTRLYTHRGVKPGTEACYRARSRNSAGWSNWNVETADADCLITLVAHTMPTGFSVQPIRTDDGESGIRLSWREPRTANEYSVTGYDVATSYDGVNWRHVDFAASDEMDVYVHEDEPGMRVYFRVRALSAGGMKGEWTAIRNAVTPAMPPSAPVISVRPDGQNAVEIRLNEPYTDGGAPITSHQIRASYFPAGGGARMTRMITVNASTRLYTHRGVARGQEACYMARSRNSVGWGEWSFRGAVCATTPGAAYAAPTLTARATGTDTIELSWNTPADRGVAFGRYELQRSLDGQTGWSSTEIKDEGTTSHEVSGLEPGTRYYFRVRVVEDNHEPEEIYKGLDKGEWSTIRNATTQTE